MGTNILIRIPLDLDRRRYFQFDMAAIVRWETATGKPFFSFKLWRDLSKKKKDTVLMFWACLSGDDPGLKPKDVVRIIESMHEVKWKAALDKLDDSLSDVIKTFTGGE